MRQLPEFECYMERTSKNYGMNALRFFDAEGNVFWFSYQTLVAFRALGDDTVCRKNEWGPTTGRHLNAIEPDKARRVLQDEFERRYAEAFPEEVPNV